MAVSTANAPRVGTRMRRSAPHSATSNARNQRRYGSFRERSTWTRPHHRSLTAGSNERSNASEGDGREYRHEGQHRNMEARIAEEDQRLRGECGRRQEEEQ